MEFILNLCEAVNKIVWGDGMIIFMLAVGIYFSVATNFFQITKFGSIMKNTVFGIFEKKGNGITPFQAVSTALAGTIGTGNIAGVATAITAGGPGAIFWMWISGIFGMMTKYAEVVLAVHFRKKEKDGTLSGGPMYYIEYGLSSRLWGIIFAALCIFASFGIGNMTQSNSIAHAAYETFFIPPYITGVFVALICGAVLLGGVKAVARFSEIIVPFMAIFYITGSVIFLTVNREFVMPALGLIVRSAFSGKSVCGGIAGAAVKYGIARGIFTNEAGMGSAPIAHGSAETDSPAKQGMWGIFEVFFDTIVMCTITALVILTADGGKFYTCGADGAVLTAGAFSTVFGMFGSSFISVAIIFFALASIAGWAFYGQKAVEYITKNRIWVNIYKTAFVLFVFAGTVMELTAVWSISDALNGLMLICNLAAILLLSPIVIKLTKNKY